MSESTSSDPSAPPAAEMAWVPTGSFLMGSEDFYPEERPVRLVHVDGFWIDTQPVTVAAFRRFVKATGYVTLAERPPDPDQYPDADPSVLVPGSLVFRRTAGPVGLDDYRSWWSYVPGACWKAPEGPGSDVYTRGRHPVVHVAHEDAQAYAAWAGKALATEAEWEYAARGGLEAAVYAWGDDPFPGGRPMANTWQGEFPWQNLCLDGWEGTSRVGAFPSNGYGLSDMCGNIWEWTASVFTVRSADAARAPCCAPSDAHADDTHGDGHDAGPRAPIPRRVIKGGSHLCAPNYCLRYRPAARQGEAVDTSTTHIGFRCLSRP